MRKVWVMASLLVAGLILPSYAERVVTEGSTTVLPIAQKAAEVFMQQHAGADIVVRGGGSGVGISSLIDGTCDIANASRAMKTDELEKAVSRGVDPQAHVVAMDGIAVIVSASNPVKALTKKQIKAIYTGKVRDWSEVGGTGGSITIVSRDTSSGTFEAFGELALDKEKVTPAALMQASNQAVASTVARTPSAIGYVGLGYMSGQVKAVEVEGVMPSKETVLANKYPISRPLFMYTNGAPKGLLKDFIDFILGPEGQRLVDEEGFVGVQ